MTTTTGVRRRDLLALGGAAAALTPLVGWAQAGTRAARPPTIWWAPDDRTPLRSAPTLSASHVAPDALRLIVEGRSGGAGRAALALRHPTLPDLWHTVWADDGQPGGAPAGVA
ncbi:MAG: hypothetical protein KC583_17905, partial [Myxococcales bacterium]|nr:hypothetical protein [Myxococcales bacterium]